MIKLHWMFKRYMEPAGDADQGGAGGGTVDRGDNWTSTDDEVKKPDVKPDADTTGATDTSLRDGGGGDESDVDPDNPDKGSDGKADKDDKAKADARIPLSRHKEILEAERGRREALEQQLSKFQQGQQVAATNDEITQLEDKLIAKEAEYNKALADGEIDSANKLMREIRAMDRDITDKRTSMNIQAAEARAVERVRYDTLVERMEEAYPQLNPEHEDFDKTKTAEVLELKAAYQATGYTPSQALQKAIKLVMPPKTKAQESAAETTPRVSAEDAAKAKADARAAEQRKKNADVAGKQPPATTKVGQDHDKLGGQISAKDVLKMSQDDFMKLDEKTLAAMRGDELEV